MWQNEWMFLSSRGTPLPQLLAGHLRPAERPVEACTEQASVSGMLGHLCSSPRVSDGDGARQVL